MSQNGKLFKQQYYRKIIILSLCRLVLLSGNFQSQHFAEGEIFQ